VDAFSFLRRRTLLKLTIGAVAVLGAGAGGMVAMRGSAPAVDKLRILTAQEYRTLVNIARAQLPRGGPFPTGAEDLDIARTFDAFLADEGPQNQSDLKTALMLVEYGPVLFDASMTTFSNLDDAARDAHWRSWCESDVLLRRQVATAFRKFVLLVSFDNPKLWAPIGYAGPSLWGMPK
jgi:hypothetical protein